MSQANSVSACSTCKGVIPGAKLVAEHISGFFFHNLETSANKGCPICSLYHRGLLALYSRDYCTESFYELERNLDFMSLMFGSRGFGRKSIDFYGERNCPPPWGVFRTGPTFPSHFGSDKCMSLIKDWVTDCETNHTHPNCQDSAATLLPTRVIDLEKRDGPELRLVETKGRFGRYMALSHCWGRARHFVTTKNNFQGMKQGFSLEDLPSTIRDAIAIARTLEIRYLWIDSICM